MIRRRPALSILSRNVWKPQTCVARERCDMSETVGKARGPENESKVIWVTVGAF